MSETSVVRMLSKEQTELLKKPLPKESIKPHPTKPYLSTIKAIYVVERLNEVFGIGGWYVTNEVQEVIDKNIVVKSTFHADEYGIVIPDIFGGNDNVDRGDAYKGACTDALTKIGSYLYIGMDVYKGLADKESKPAAKAEPNPEPKKTKRSDWYYEFRDAMEASTTLDNLNEITAQIKKHEADMDKSELTDLRTLYKKINNKIITEKK